MQTNRRMLDCIEETVVEDKNEHNISNRRDQDIKTNQPCNIAIIASTHRSCKHGTCAIVGYCIREEVANAATRRHSSPVCGQRISPLNMNTPFEPSDTGNCEKNGESQDNISINRNRFASI
ncbi:hypothetical protein GUITHDRAFT_155511 [Guillardia theta CCMP2712]|uniref:Uncharacterized protein n=1 Tax=Guillardia theta (strain CCMP2712) TaxID=905079 RepID=L1IGI7_GUITC|nr:hypothetical protein GUITHDRAFT_155511 [Guillardia theta CCMP2712]EKX35328.1 hypothetical protein GUITHDRAFT_155511 [Guillardia theta CCMP2712]|mmetsp:Transcript_17422/g.57661  ORF Transcript_17422/g.57661 Transcript_17422/m.57661 type:complete len:121 (-) Transcript_17422:24-386(-)|eukprot:XP_005822308.1 hypothetical protein GUITHDRAFT_155511 [Guillardia theta CCMP2712]